MFESHSGRGIPSWILIINEEAQHRQRRFSISQSMYDAAYVGEFYRAEMRIGFLDIPYRWTWQTPSPALFRTDNF
jgi:hypothetical protein